MESNAHFPTDYNLLYDCIRKCCDKVQYFHKKYPTIKGYRKIKDWSSTLKNLMRQVGQISSKGGSNKEERLKNIVQNYIEKSGFFEAKMQKTIIEFPQESIKDITQTQELEVYIKLMTKHIGLVYRRLILQETIPHEEKLFSIFEQYTEWITKGKIHKRVELGNKFLVTSNEFNLIIDYQIMESQTDSQTVKDLVDRISTQYKISSWSFDKGFYSLENKEYLKQKVDHVIMPKKGKCNKEESIEEQDKTFKKLRNKHSAIESNINELENRRLDRCPDRGYKHFKTYAALGICAYNLKKIGREILKQQISEEQKKLKMKFKQAA